MVRYLYELSEQYGEAVKSERSFREFVSNVLKKAEELNADIIEIPEKGEYLAVENAEEFKQVLPELLERVKGGMVGFYLRRAYRHGEFCYRAFYLDLTDRSSGIMFLKDIEEDLSGYDLAGLFENYPRIARSLIATTASKCSSTSPESQ